MRFPMRNGPLEVVWDIRCSSAGECEQIRTVLERETDRAHKVVQTMEGGGATSTREHRLADYFERIEIAQSEPAREETLRLTFRRWPRAGRYWRDLMVR